MRVYLLLHLAPYLLLMTAACWHAIGLGTQGLRGRIVHWIVGAGMAWGVVTPPWGWAQIGAAVLTVVAARWLRTPEGRAAAAVGVAALVAAGDAVLRLLGRTVAWVLSPRTHEAPPAELSEKVPAPVWTGGSQLATTPPAHLFEPEAWRRNTAHDTPPAPALAPVETYADILGTVLAGNLGFNDGARYVATNFGVSRSKYATDMRALRAAAA